MAIFKDKKKTKDGRQYYFAIHKKEDSSKVYKSKRYLTRKEALEEQAKYILKHDNPNRINFHIVSMNYFDNLKTYCKYSTIYTYIKDYNKHICPYFGDKDINSINVHAYNLWYDSMAKNGFSVKYLNKINSLLKNIFQFAVQNYGLEVNPVVKTFKSKNDKIVHDKIRYITKEEFNKFISVADNDTYKLLFKFLFLTGARIGEVICLTWNDINLQDKYVSITKTLYKIHDNKPTSNKTHTNRRIYLNDSFVRELASFKAIKGSFKDFSNDWYVFGDIKTLSTTQIARKKHEWFIKSGVHEITIHEFRHSHVSCMVQEYLKHDIDSTKFFIMMSQRLGHTIPVMQKTYLHLFPNTQDDLVKLLNSVT